MNVGFRQSLPLERRQEISAGILAKNPGCVPVIVERHSKAAIAEIDEKKHIVPGDITVAKFMMEIRKNIELEKEEAIYLFVGDVLAPPNDQMSRLYEKHKAEDGFVYVIYSKESAFGADRKANQVGEKHIVRSFKPF